MVFAERQTAAPLKQALPAHDPAARAIREVHELTRIEDDGVLLELHPLGHASGPGNLAVLIPHRGILFAGEVCSNGPKNSIGKRAQQSVDRGHRTTSADVGRDRRPRFRRHRGPRDSSAAEGLPRGTRPGVSATWSRNRNLVTSSLAGSLFQIGAPVSPILSNWFPYDIPDAADIGHLFEPADGPHEPLRE